MANDTTFLVPAAASGKRPVYTFRCSEKSLSICPPAKLETEGCPWFSKIPRVRYPLSSVPLRTSCAARWRKRNEFVRSPNKTIGFDLTREENCRQTADHQIEWNPRKKTPQS